MAGEPRLRDPLVAGSLLVLADDALDQPVRAEQLGAAAFAILSTQDADLAGRNLAMLLRAAWTILRSRRVQGRFDEAGAMLRDAVAFLGAAPAVSEERALLLCGVAQLRWAERRLDEAAALFARAALLFGECGERQGEAACRAQAAWVLLEAADLRCAWHELTGAQRHLDAELAPALAARIALARCWTSLAIGQPEPARERLAAARRLCERAAAGGEALLHRWWEARIAALDGRASEADASLDAVRRELLRAGSVPEAARCTLDLLELRVGSQRLDALSQLAPDLLDGSGCRLSALRPAQAIDWLAGLAERRAQRFRPALAAVRHYLAGLRPPPRDYVAGQPPFPQDRPDLIADVTELVDALLLAVRGGGVAAA